MGHQRFVELVKFGLGLMSMLLSVSCHSHMFTYLGATVAEADGLRLSLGGPYTDQWKSSDLSIYYRYWWNNGHLKLSGAIELAPKLTHFRNLARLDVEIHFLNEAGGIIESRRLYSSGFRQWLSLVDWSFEKNLEMPADATQIAFSYDGRVDEGGGQGNAEEGDGVSWDFWKTPFG